MKDIQIVPAFCQLIPLSLLVIGATTWAFLSPSNVAETHPHEFFLIVGFIFSYITVGPEHSALLDSFVG